MQASILDSLGITLGSLDFVNSAIRFIVNLLFAGAVARDAGKLQQVNLPIALVSPATWAFATLFGGEITAAIYWFIHHSTLTKPISANPANLVRQTT